jgi:penicillin-binding protein 2
MRRALSVSSDVYFYRMGERADQREGEVIQAWARKLGLGRTTGIDLPGEFEGLIPDREWRREIGEREKECRKDEDIPLSATPAIAATQGCGISDMRPWSTGDNVNLAIGQGDVQASPLQMAVAYATIANGGKVPRPHLGLEIEDAQGRLIQRIERDAAREIEISGAHRQAIMDGLRSAASAPGGTSTDVFAGWPHDRLPVFGKTGTAERQPRPDQSWYVAYVQHESRPLVVAATVEDCGCFGAEAAAPMVRLILSEYYDVQKRLVQGDSATR